MENSPSSKRLPPYFKDIPFNRLLPNIVTLLALCIGMSSIRFAILERWESAVISILVAAVLDGMDGRLARLLGGGSKFGAELDSLSDACNFGIAPAFIAYFYSLKTLGSIGWGIALFYAICMVCRLARFNTLLTDIEKAPPAHFFIGVPAPFGAILCLSPIMLDFQSEGAYTFPPLLYGIFIVCIALLLISRLHTFSFKGVRIPKRFLWLLFAGIGGLISSLATDLWLTLLILSGFYLLTLPLSYKAYKDYEKTHNSLS
jgi:CDP-diacylglycerol--serine O-phosphatidyltransferase